MHSTDPDFAAFMARLPTLRRYENIVRNRLHQVALRRPGTRGAELIRIAAYFRNDVQNIGPVNRALLKRMVVFADLVMADTAPDVAVEIACFRHPDPHVDSSG